jgi:hypothetical protein
MQSLSRGGPVAAVQRGASKFSENLVRSEQLPFSTQQIDILLHLSKADEWSGRMDDASLLLAIASITATLAAIGSGALIFTSRTADGDKDITADVEREHRSRLTRLESYRDL